MIFEPDSKQSFPHPKIYRHIVDDLSCYRTLYKMILYKRRSTSSNQYQSNQAYCKSKFFQSNQTNYQETIKMFKLVRISQIITREKFCRISLKLNIQFFETSSINTKEKIVQIPKCF